MCEPHEVIPLDRLPESFVRRVENPPENPPEARPAATIALLRPRGEVGGEDPDGVAAPGKAPDGDAPAPEGAASGVEVLLLRRSRSAGFVPGAWVFPGGRVDREDAQPPLLERLHGLDPDRAGERLGVGPDHDPPAAGFWVAAIREAFEETGILVGRHERGGFPPTAAEDPAVDDLRRSVLDDEDAFPRVLDILGCGMDAGAVEYVAHWITPVAEPRRYDTRFFAGVVPPGRRAVIDEREMTDARWLTPEAALDGHRSGRLPMIFPTVRTLKSLRGFPTPQAVLDAFSERSIPTILPRMVRTDEGVGIVAEEREG